MKINVVFPVIWNDGFVYFPSQVSQERGIQSFSYRGLQGQDILAELLDEAHARGLKVIPWFEFGLMTPPQSDLAKRHPDRLSRKRDGGLTSITAAGEVAWLNPFRPEVQDLIRALVLELVSTYAVDGIQFDDNMSLPREFGYDSYTLSLYRTETGSAIPPDPVDPRWVRWRADRLTALIETLVRAVRASRAGVSIVISPNYYQMAYRLQLQDWLNWVRRGLVDQLVIQAYRPDLASFEEQLDRAELLESRNRIPVSVGIHTGQRNKPVPIALIVDQCPTTIWLRGRAKQVDRS